MPLYNQTADPAILWPEPMEGVWQLLVGGGESKPNWKRPDITLPDRLFIGAVVNIPPEQRPWGSITWLADVFDTSRQTVYTIGRQARTGLWLPDEVSLSGVDVTMPEMQVEPSTGSIISVTDNRLKRTALTALLPGGVTLRPMQELLAVAFEQSRSLGFLSQLINEAGCRAGQILDRTDYSPLGEVILARDETYFDGLAFLLSVEPRSPTILSGYVEEQCDGETWGVSLAIDQHTRGLRIIGLAEDAARCYPKSLQAAAQLLATEFSVPVQKDVWHILNKAGQSVTDLERLALKKLDKAEELYQALSKEPWDEEDFDTWAKTEAAAAELLALSDQLRFWCGCLYDALELVDWRSGEIRDREINAWLLQETINGLKQLDHPRVKKLVTTLKNQAAELLTFLDWLEVQLFPWQRHLARAFPDPRDQAFFQATVARAWRLQRAVINGHASFQALADETQVWLTELMADNPQAQRLAEALLNILEGTVRTSCAVETINSILKPYLWAKRSFQSRETAQNFLNLFILWFNMHPFKRGKRAGKSPFQWAGIKVYTPDGRETDDWLEALGYPADA